MGPLARCRSKSVKMRNKNPDITSFLRLAYCHRFAVIAVFAFLTLIGDTVEVGNPIGEIVYRYPCTIGKQSIELSYEAWGDPATVSIQRPFQGTPRLVINEEAAFKQPIEVVTFEYFSACQQIRLLMEEARYGSNDPNQLLDDPSWTAELVFRSDCEAINQMRRAGLFYGWENFQAIIDIFYYERGRQSYLRVPYQERADNISNRCPF